VGIGRLVGGRRRPLDERQDLPRDVDLRAEDRVLRLQAREHERAQAAVDGRHGDSAQERGRLGHGEEHGEHHRVGVHGDAVADVRGNPQDVPRLERVRLVVEHEVGAAPRLPQQEVLIVAHALGDHHGRDVDGPRRRRVASRRRGSCCGWHRHLRTCQDGERVRNGTRIVRNGTEK
jgi:hypothetical protein